MQTLVDKLRAQLGYEKEKSKAEHNLLINMEKRLENIQRDNVILQAMKDFIIKNIDNVSAAIIEAQRGTIQEIHNDENVKAVINPDGSIDLKCPKCGDNLGRDTQSFVCVSLDCDFTKELQGGDVIVVHDN